MQFISNLLIKKMFFYFEKFNGLLFLMIEEFDGSFLIRMFLGWRVISWKTKKDLQTSEFWSSLSNIHKIVAYWLTLDSGIALHLLNLGIFSKPYRYFQFCTQKSSESIHLFFLAKFFWPYIYSFCHIFYDLHLFFLANVPNPTIIPCPSSIPESRVKITVLKKRPAKAINKIILNCMI